MYLLGRGLALVERNYRTRYGEIDLIMRHGEALVFVEVRYRNSTRFGGAIQSVTPDKRRRLKRTALHFLKQHPGMAVRPARFDILALDRFRVTWITNAFE